MNEQKTVIGINTFVNGTVEGDEDLVVEGRAEGRISISRALIVAHTGIVQAEVNAQSVVINGVLVGNITAEESVQIAKEGRVMGDIRATRVVLEDGASFTGHIDMGELNLAPSLEEAKPLASAPRDEEVPKWSLFKEPADDEKGPPVETFTETRPRTPIPTQPPPTRTIPSFSPTKSPTFAPSVNPSFSPTKSPIFAPSVNPSFPPTKSPTFAPSASGEKKSAPMPRVRPLGHLKAKRKSF